MAATGNRSGVLLSFGLRGVRLTYQYMDVKRIGMLVNGVNNSVLTCVSV